jgi:hypothetical protein
MVPLVDRFEHLVHCDTGHFPVVNAAIIGSFRDKPESISQENCEDPQLGGFKAVAGVGEQTDRLWSLEELVDRTST